MHFIERYNLRITPKNDSLEDKFRLLRSLSVVNLRGYNLVIKK